MAQNSAPTPINPTAETPTGATPSLSLGEETKISYAPDWKTAATYLKSIPNRTFEISYKTEDDHKTPILNDINDLYLIPKNAPDNIDNNYLDHMGTRVTPGFWGTVINAVPSTLLSVGGGIAGAPLGAGMGPIGILGAASAGAGVGAGAGDLLNQKIGANLYNKPFDPDYKRAATAAAIGAATEGVGRGIIAPILKAGLPNVSTSVGEKAMTALEKPTTVKIGGQDINVGKLIKGSLEQQNPEIANINKPFKEQFKALKTEQANNPTPLGNAAEAAKLTDLFKELNTESGGAYGPLQGELADTARAGEEAINAVREMRGNENLTNEQIVTKLQDPNYYKQISNVLERRFQPRGMGMSYEDIMGIKPRQLNFLAEMTAKRETAGLIPAGTSKALQDLVNELGDLQASMSREKAFIPKSLKGPEDLGYNAPVNYGTRGSQLLGGAGAQSAKTLAEALKNQLQK